MLKRMPTPEHERCVIHADPTAVKSICIKDFPETSMFGKPKGGSIMVKIMSSDRLWYIANFDYENQNEKVVKDVAEEYRDRVLNWIDENTEQ